MKKENKCYRIYFNDGCYKADCTIVENGCYYFRTLRFIFYSKKEVIRELRNTYNCIVPRDAY